MFGRVAIEKEEAFNHIGFGMQERGKLLTLGKKLRVKEQYKTLKSGFSRRDIFQTEINRVTRDIKTQNQRISDTLS